MPAAESTVGWTKMMYADVRNVVAPASTSVRTEVPAARRRKGSEVCATSDPLLDHDVPPEARDLLGVHVLADLLLKLRL